MIDPLALGVDAIARGDAARLPLAVAAGIATSVGPCVAPRYIALAAVLGKRRRALTIAAFVTGMLTAYAALGFGTGLLAQVTGHASALYVVLALALAGGGAVTLLRRGGCERAHHEHPAARAPKRLSGVFSLGAGSAFVVSPCCTPVVAAVIGLGASDANVLARAALLAAFALGHAAPLFAAGSLGALCSRFFRTWETSPAPAVVSGSLMLALGAYYGLLA
jgi:cytochrome c biogenesis protein CcdA